MPQQPQKQAEALASFYQRAAERTGLLARALYELGPTSPECRRTLVRYQDRAAVLAAAARRARAIP